MIKKYILILSFIIGLSYLTAQEDVEKSRDIMPECKKCHICNNPTRKNPCLKSCPRFDLMTIHHSAEDGPEVIILDVLTDLYVPVVFSHKLHAEMASMSGGCQICHHHNPSGEITPCAECHPGSGKRADLSRPSLKGAYHRQCLGCHREWSHTTQCAICHALKSAQDADVVPVDTTDIIGSKHPPIPEPEKIVFETVSEEGKLVTFFHGEHVNLFNLNCVSCHEKENCSKCHDWAKPTLAEQMASGKTKKVHKTEEEHHKACYRCHEGDKCKFCHSDVQKSKFDHFTRTGWAITNYHSAVNCNRCHKKSGIFTGLKKSCEYCHQNWNHDNFNHDITGISLDENHAEIECSTCHSENSYSLKPNCSECHDEDIRYPQRQPGTVLKK